MIALKAWKFRIEVSHGSALAEFGGLTLYVETCKRVASEPAIWIDGDGRVQRGRLGPLRWVAQCL